MSQDEGLSEDDDAPTDGRVLLNSIMPQEATNSQLSHADIGDLITAAKKKKNAMTGPVTKILRSIDSSKKSSKSKAFTPKGRNQVVTEMNTLHSNKLLAGADIKKDTSRESTPIKNK